MPNYIPEIVDRFGNPSHDMVVIEGTKTDIEVLGSTLTFIKVTKPDEFAMSWNKVLADMWVETDLSPGMLAPSVYWQECIDNPGIPEFQKAWARKALDAYRESLKDTDDDSTSP